MANSAVTQLRRHFLTGLLIGWVLSGLAARTSAQETTAGVTGVVTDRSKAFVPGVTIKATEESTGFVRSSITDADGRYSLSDLAMGTYTLTATLRGFKTYRRSGFGPLTANQIARLDIEMVVGDVVESVEVTGAAPLLQTQTSVVQTAITQDQIENLPLNSRSPVELLLQQPGVQASQFYQLFGIYLALNFNGQNSTGNNFALDGTDASVVADNTLTITGGNLVAASVDSIAEFDSGSQNYSADVKGAGGYVNIITKSGTNKFHGDVFEFLRNDVFDAKTFFAAHTEKLRLNDFGATITGPIKRGKTFFMGSWEEQRIHRPTTSVTTVPTSDFRSTVDPRLSQVLQQTPLPTEPIAGNPDLGLFTSSPLDATRQDLVTGRIDNIFSEKDSLFGRYTINDLSINQAGVFTGFASLTNVRHQYLTLSETHAFGSTLLNTVKLGANRYVENDVQSAPPGETSFFTIPGTSIAGGMRTILFPHTAGQVNDDVIWNKGKHSLKFGGYYWGTIYGRGQFVGFTYVFPTLGAFALDQPSSVFDNLGPGQNTIGNHFSDTNLGWYGQDDFHATPNLTINLGLRYDNYGVMSESRSRIVNIVDNPLGPFRAPGQPIYERNNLDFAPRIGFAWQPFGQKRLVIRGGYGMFYGGPASLEETITLQSNLVNAFLVTSTQNPTLAYPLNPSGLTQVVSTPTRFIVDPFAKDPYNQQWSLVTQYAISKSATVTAGYVGSHGVHVPGETEPNAFNPLLGQPPDPNLGNVYEQINQDSTLYNGLQLSYRQRLSHGLALNAYYTWSHAIGIETSYFEIAAGEGVDEQIQTFTDRRLSRGNLPMDQRHNLTLDFHYELPRTGLSGVASRLLNGWGASGIVKVTSGLPFDLVTGGDTGDGRFVQRPNILPGVDPYIKGASPANGFLNPAAFAIPTQVDPSTGLILGDMANNMLNLPVFFSMDFALAKETRIREGLDLEFRAEFFNLTNHPNFGAPVNSIAAGSLFGVSQSVGAAREGQLGLKLKF
jgi:Carboxypeptidase regulatory-like domain/TonB dependent receptor